MNPLTAFGSGTKRSGGPYFCPAVTAQYTNCLNVCALSPDFVGMITYVKVEIAYAFLPHFLGGSTILSCSRAVTFAGTSQSAADTPRMPGVEKPPALFWISANWYLF